MAADLTGFLAGTRGLQRIFIPEQGFWLFVWCHDDGDLEVNHCLAYCVCSSPADFYPPNGKFILVRDSEQAFKYVYGVPYRIEAYKGIVKFYYTDLNIALAFDRKATGETDATSSEGKDPTQGYCLEGLFLAGNSTEGPMIWAIKNVNWHDNPGPVLEVTDVTASTFKQGDASGYSAPTGAMLIEYQRDHAGRVKVDKDGFPLVAMIDPTAGWYAQNFKIGYLGLSFQKDYYGLGIHGWIGSGGRTPDPPFMYYPGKTSTKEAPKASFTAGLLNGLLPTNIFSELSFDSTGTHYVKLNCDTDGKKVTAINIVIDGTEPGNGEVTMGAASDGFDVLLYVIVEGEWIRVWGDGNVKAEVIENIRTDKLTPTPGGSPWDIWYAWRLSLV